MLIRCRNPSKPHYAFGVISILGPLRRSRRFEWWGFNSLRGLFSWCVMPSMMGGWGWLASALILYGWFLHPRPMGVFANCIGTVIFAWIAWSLDFWDLLAIEVAIAAIQIRLLYIAVRRQLTRTVDFVFKHRLLAKYRP